MERIPETVAGALGTVFIKVLDQCTMNNVTAWRALLSFAKLMLCRCPKGQAVRTISQRVTKWQQGKLGELYEEMLQVTRENDAIPVVSDVEENEGYTVDDATIPRCFENEGYEFSGDPTSIPAAAIKRALKHAEKGEFARAQGALAAAKQAPFAAVVADALQAKHPGSDADPRPALQPLTGDALQFGHKAARKGVQSFSKGAGAGPSGLSADHLKMFASALMGRVVYLALATFATRVAAGKVPEAVRPYFFAAKLTALLKSDGGYRPVACGETLRRFAAKLICLVTKPAARDALLPYHQVGVGVAGGAEAAATAARLLANQWIRDACSTKAIIIVDAKNAFNEYDREESFKAVHDFIPAALPFAQAAYEKASLLFFGKFTILSRRGGHQGCPFSPPKFGCVLARAWRKVLNDPALVEIVARMDLKVWFLDDGLQAADRSDLQRLFPVLEAAMREVGLQINHAKCTIISLDAAADAAAFPTIPHKDLRDWSFLGVPCGTPEHCAAFIDAKMRLADNKTRAVAQLPCPHKAYAMLRYTASASLASYYMRAHGPHPAFARFDDAVREAWNTAVFPLPPDKQAQFELPIRHSGFGLPPTAPMAGVAFLAQVIASRKVFDRICSADLQMNLRDDPLFNPAFESLQLHSLRDKITGCLDSQDKDLQTKGLQKKFAAMITMVKAATLLESQPTREAKARIQSCSSPYSAGYLTCTPPIMGMDMQWLTAQEFTLLARYRLGMPVADMDGPCNMCRKRGVISDKYGYHTTSCMKSGLRNVCHSHLRDVIFTKASTALMNAEREVRPFLADPLAASGRLDIKISNGYNFDLLDTAIINPLQPRFVARAAMSQGGAATAYEAIKVTRYGAAVNNLGPRYSLVPVIMDTFGAWGESAIPCIKRIASEWGKRFDVSKSRAIPLIFQEISFIATRAIAGLLVRNSVIDVTLEHLQTADLTYDSDGELPSAAPEDPQHQQQQQIPVAFQQEIPEYHQHHNLEFVDVGNGYDSEVELGETLQRAPLQGVNIASTSPLSQATSAQPGPSHQRAPHITTPGTQ